MSTPTPSTKILRSPLLAIFIALVFVTGPMPGPIDVVETASALPTGLAITEDDYETVVEELFGLGAYAYVVVTDDTLDETEQRDLVRGVTVTNGTAASEITIDLIETGAETGVFIGGFGFRAGGLTPQLPGSHPFLGRLGITDSGARQGAELPVGDGDDVKVTAGSHSETIEWRAATSATIVAENAANDVAFTTVFGAADPIFFTITDPDLNQDTNTEEPYEDLLFVWTDSQPEGRFVTITENGTDTGVFEATVEFKTAQSGPEDRLWVRQDDRIQATFTEPYNGDGDLEVHKTRANALAMEWAFEQSTAGSVRLGHPQNEPWFFGETTPGTETGRDRMVVFVTDADPNKGAEQDEVTVEVNAQSVTLKEHPGFTIGAPATFSATVGFVQTGSTCPTSIVDACITVADGDTIEAVYQEDIRPPGSVPLLPATATWFAAAPAEVVLDQATTEVLFGTTNDIDIVVTDSDANTNPATQETIRAFVKSTTSPTSLEVTLTEDSGNSDRFTGTFQFATTATSGRLHVADGDRVTVEYVDRVGVDGNEKTVRANDGQYVVWRQRTDGQVSTDSTDYYRQLDGTNIVTVAHVFVNDMDQNNPTKRDSLDVTAITLGTGPEATSLTLRELGIDSGLFYGQLDFNDLFGTLPTAPKDFTIQYVEAQSPGGSTLTRDAGTLTFWPKPTEGSEAVLRFEHVKRIDGVDVTEKADRFYVNESGDNEDREETIRVVLYAPDGIGDEIEAKLESTFCTEDDDVGNEDEHRALPLRDDGDDGGADNRYVGVFTIREIDAATGCEGATTGPNYLGVDIDEPFTASLSLPGSVDVLTATATAKELMAEVGAFKDASGSDIARTSGLNKPVYMQVQGWNHNADSTRREHMVHEVFNPDTSGATKITLLETGVNTGIFSGSFAFTHGSPSDMNGLVHVEDDLGIRIASATGDFNAALPGYGLHSGAQFDTGLVRDSVGWFPVTDAMIDVSKRAFGSSSFEIELTDGDGLAHRVFELDETSSSQELYTFANTPYIPGSELIFIVEEITTEHDTTAATYSTTISYDRNPAEKIADLNLDGIVDCLDVSIEGFYDVPGLPGQGGSSTPVEIHCVSVELGSTTRITYAFTDARGDRSCTPDPAPLVDSTCRAVIQVPYRPALLTTCPSATAEKTPYEYRRESNGIRLCDNAASGLDIHLMYMQAEREITVRSHETTDSAALETEVVTLNFDSADSRPADNVWIFSGLVPVQTTAGSNDDTIHVEGSSTVVDFHFADPTQTFDSQAGSAQRDHFRTTKVSDVWRAADSATVRIMTPDFSTDAGATAFGPAVPVLIEDRDSNRYVGTETIDVTIRDPSGGDDSFTLTLLEDGDNAFRGIIPVSNSLPSAGAPDVLDLGCPTSDPNCSKVIEVRYADPFGTNGNPTTRSTTIDWRPADEGDLRVCRVAFVSGDCPTGETPTTTNLIEGNDGRLFVRVEDPDANKRSGNLDPITINVASTSNPAGESIELLETTGSSGVFESAGIRFEKTLIGGNGRVFTRDHALFGDTITVTYEDPQDANGNRRVITSDPTGWDVRSDGVVDIALDFYIGTDRAAETDLANATIVVKDGDGNVDPRAVDVIELEQCSSVSPAPTGTCNFRMGAWDGSTITGSTATTIERLVETGANTGEFIGVTSFKDSGSSEPEDLGVPDPAKIRMSNTGEWRFSFVDRDPSSGSGETVFSDNSQWFRRGYGVVNFDAGGYVTREGGPKVRLYDADITTSSHSVTVTSNADPDGVAITLNEQRDGMFEGTLTLLETGGGSGLLVNDEDEITVQYTDGSPAGTRTDTATIAIGDLNPPVTELVTIPADPDGENDWFVTQPTVSFVPNKNVENTFYRRDGGDPIQFNTPFTVNEGLNEFEFWSVGFGDIVEDVKTQEVNFDATPPTTSVSGLAARSAPLGAIDLSWDPVTKTDPLQFGSYKVYQGTTANFVGNTSSESFSHTPDSDGPATYLVAVADMAGNVNLEDAVSVSGISDRVAPRLVSATVSPTELFEELDDNLTVVITATVNEADFNDLDRVEASIIDPNREGVGNITLSRQGTTNVYRGTFADFEVSGNYTFSIAALDEAGNSAPIEQNVRFHAIDREPPRVVVPSEVVQGQPLAVEVFDNDKGVATISYRLDGAAAVNVPVSGAPLSHTFSIPTAALSLGSHSLSLTVTDRNATANFATYEVTFTVTDGSGAPPAQTGAPRLSLLNKFVESGGELRLGVQGSAPLTVLSVAYDGGAAESVLSSWGGSTSATRVDIGSLAAGKHTVTVTATNALDTATRTFEIYVLPPGVPLPPGDVVVTKGADGFPTITWTASQSNNVGGYLVHRSSSPYVVIAVLDADDFEFTDRTAKAGTAYLYAVTAYGTNGQGRLDEGATSDEALPWVLELEGSSFTVDEPDSNFWTVFWVILILLVVVSAVVLLVVYRERIFRPRGEEGEIYDDDYPDASGTTTLPFGEQQHDLRCPNCTTEFSVTGEKPIVTTCPNCGKKGILR